MNLIFLCEQLLKYSHFMFISIIDVKKCIVIVIVSKFVDIFRNVYFKFCMVRFYNFCIYDCTVSVKKIIFIKNDILVTVFPLNILWHFIANYLIVIIIIIFF